MNTAAQMMLATGITAARVGLVGVTSSTKPANQARNVTRVILGGVVATAGLLMLDQFSPALAGGLATVIMLTALLVHGVALADAAMTLVK